MSKYNKYRNVLSKKEMNGYEVARLILDRNGLQNIRVEETEGVMSDHYDPRDKVVRLSTAVYHDKTVASIAIAAHECGHVLQDKDKYMPMKIRGAIVPIVNFASTIGYVVMFIGFIFSLLDLAFWGIVLLSATLVFQLITLPVEFNASNRAIKTLDGLRIVEGQERKQVKTMLSAAAFTYVASLLANLLEILRLFISVRRD